ncbi:type II toxin-antitoxin system VapC family toxin [Antarcticirhabdus aurantiaca]|uniref:type II toxin-antitoxin system VapC family toxin n=1 Tax=Antarcticirhabdus aurantiaca TaxID=2606717 RepID=UPI00131A6399|nr:type II toxin-antitoxin system VapC family toxin [Antarcticirhabdus aurantiaca]
MSLGERSIYLDANAIIRFVESQESSITALFGRAAAGEFRLVTSEMTLAECLVVPMRDRDVRLIAGYEGFLQSDETMTVVPVDRAVLRRSAELRARLGGKTPDAIHCATAELLSCGIVVSSDKRLRLPDGLRRVDVEDASLIGRNR